jgi:hypothetical protein
MGGFTQKPGATTLVQQQAPGRADAHPGKRTLVEQADVVGSATAQRTQSHAADQRDAAADDATLPVSAPAAGIDKPGFIDNSKGAPVYAKPAELGGGLVRETPLPPAARVFVSGSHPSRTHWWYVTAYLEQAMVRGYVEDFRVNTDLPEPLAELRQLNGGETAEGLAKEKFRDAVTDGHDLRYYENVLLYVNRDRKGIKGTYQDPGILRRGNNNIQLVAGHRIWLVSADYAKALEGVVPSGSLTGGAVAKARRFARHLEDILQSVTESRHHFDEVAGEFAQAIRDHMPAIIGITAGFLTAEASSMFLAAAPTGVSQAAAAVIQLALSAFGAAGMIQAGIEALKHGSSWLTIAWTANGDAEHIAEASREFVRMLVAIAIAALSRAGAKANYRNAIKIANNMPTAGLPALAAVSGGSSGGAQAGSGVAIGAGLGGPGIAGNAALRLTDSEKAALGEGPDVDHLHDKDIHEARASERHDRRAADGRRPTEPDVEPTAAEAPPRPGTRTELAKHVPPPGDAFVDWFDSLTSRELDKLLADKGRQGTIGAADVIAENIRHPGNQHEWLMVAEARKFKQWGVSMRTIREGRTLTEATIGKRFRHGGAGSGTMHRDLRAMIRSSNSYEEFLQKLNAWADRELVPSHSTRWPHDAALGRYNLPENLQVRGHR